MCRVLLLLVLSVGVLRPSATLTVAPGGELTPAAARDQLRQMQDGAAKRIVLRGGNYFLSETLRLDQRDSGLTIEAYPGEKPVLYGGRRITGWKPDGGGLWAAELPEVKAGQWDFRMLAVNGAFRHRSRMPETGAFEHRTEFKVKWMGTTGGGWQRKPTADELSTMSYRAGDLPAGFDPTNAEITVFHMWDESLVRVSSVDAAAHTIRFRTPTSHPAGAFDIRKYAVWNLREGLKRPGQWYLDRTAGKVVYWPLDGEDMATAEVLAPTLERVVHIEGAKDAPARHITISGLSVAVANTPARAGGFGATAYDGAVAANFAHDCRLLHLTVFNTGGQGIKALETERLAVRDCTVHAAGASGILVRGSDAELSGNLVYSIGLTYPSAIGISCHGQRFRISHNEVHDTPYTAVIFSGSGHLVEANLVYRAMLVLHDGAAFYSGSARDVLVRGNLVRDIPDTVGYGSSAYYLDELSENCTIEGNVSVNVARPTHNHIGRRNFIRNNIFLHDGPMKLTFPRSNGYIVERNVIQASGTITFRMPAGAIAALPDNIIHSGAGQVNLEAILEHGLAGPVPLEPRDGSVYVDPGLLNPAPGVYRFRPGSPALRLGIRPVDARNAGTGRSK